ncbi:MAG: tRNA (adenosine(37)-N6)-dimethylallyltransferase MiaA [Rhodospirillaceae bacterium TMED8]|nr:tRNA (adenosine(37)-N6)-dimethylallyltransferase MiaA [Magnetovibrio sp.]OUT48937.1 MAG: tRNA (adenosine(37)-N6)-dimethylallyltransferase MiaA [Rhodospirillaceae bacterium TMED8]|tara:strand:+ start:2271 stop:3257 length:987 start_codon:yes stop_codon:yes gene_type:complete
MQNIVREMAMNRGKELKIVIVTGPTASGKSQLATNISTHFGGEIINADSMQVYRDLRILSARPKPEEEMQLPHHLYGVVAASKRCSAGEWLRMAKAVIYDIHSRGTLPVVCGGTGLYIKVLMEGIAQIPSVPEALASEGRSLLQLHGIQAVYQRLLELDKNAADRLNPNDTHRILRAYEVIRATGRSLNEWQSGSLSLSPLNACFIIVCLMPDRVALYRKIEDRIDEMLQAGALEEVAALNRLKIDPEMPVMKALGVPSFRNYLNGNCNLENSVKDAKQVTRNYAKRQMTWFRNQIKPDIVHANFGAEAFDCIKPILASRLVHRKQKN